MPLITATPAKPQALNLDQAKALGKMKQTDQQTPFTPSRYLTFPDDTPRTGSFPKFNMDQIDPSLRSVSNPEGSGAPRQSSKPEFQRFGSFTSSSLRTEVVEENPGYTNVPPYYSDLPDFPLPEALNGRRSPMKSHNAQQELHLTAAERQQQQSISPADMRPGSSRMRELEIASTSAPQQQQQQELHLTAAERQQVISAADLRPGSNRLRELGVGAMTPAPPSLPPTGAQLSSPEFAHTVEYDYRRTSGHSVLEHQGVKEETGEQHEQHPLHAFGIKEEADTHGHGHGHGHSHAQVHDHHLGHEHLSPEHLSHDHLSHEHALAHDQNHSHSLQAFKYPYPPEYRHRQVPTPAPEAYRYAAPVPVGYNVAHVVRDTVTPNAFGTWGQAQRPLSPSPSPERPPYIPHPNPHPHQYQHQGATSQSHAHGQHVHPAQHHPAHHGHHHSSPPPPPHPAPAPAPGPAPAGGFEYASGPSRDPYTYAQLHLPPYMYAGTPQLEDSTMTYPAYEGAKRQRDPLSMDGTPVPPQWMGMSGFWGKGVIHTWHTGVKPSPTVFRICAQCHTDKPGAKTWRRSKLQKETTLCNKCGIYEHTHHKPRPKRHGDHQFEFSDRAHAETYAYMSTPRSNRANARVKVNSPRGIGGRCDRTGGGGGGAGMGVGVGMGAGAAGGPVGPLFGGPPVARKKERRDEDEWRYD